MKKVIVVFVLMYTALSGFADGFSSFEVKIIRADSDGLFSLLVDLANRQDFIKLYNKFSRLDPSDSSFRKDCTTYYSQTNGRKMPVRLMFAYYWRLRSVSEVGASEQSPGAQNDACISALESIPIDGSVSPAYTIDTVNAIITFSENIKKPDPTTVVGDCWISQVVQEVDGDGNFNPNYDLAEFFADGSATITSYSGNTVVNSWKGTYTDSTISWNTTKYHSYTYQLRNGLLYLYAFNSANIRVSFNPFQKVWKD
jgi:hypothetical protein